MKSKDIDVKSFKTIYDLYRFIDQNLFHFERERDLVNLWVRFRDHTINDQEKLKAQWEIDCFIFEIIGTRIFSHAYSGADSSEEIKKYPELSAFQADIINYVINRAQGTNNSLLKSRYYHLLWKGPKGVKDNQYAFLAVNNYITAIKEHLNTYKIHKHKDTLFQITHLFNTLLGLLEEVKVDANELKCLTRTLLFESNGIDFYTRYSIIKNMLEHPKIFKPSDFENVLKIFEEQIIEREIDTDLSILTDYHIPTAISVANKTKSDVKNWYDIQGMAYLKMSEKETEEERFWVKQHFNSKAIDSFTKAKNIESKKRAEQLYADLKPKVKLPLTTYNFDDKAKKEIKDFDDYLKAYAKEILKKSADEIYLHISKGHFFPKYMNVIRDSVNKENDFLNFARTFHFDKNNNISMPNSEITKKHEMYETYAYYIQMTVLPHLHYLIIPGIKSGKLSYANLISYLSSNSWIGKTYIKYDFGNNGKKVNWIGNLSPALIEYFCQIQAWVSCRHYKPNFILCVDSLTLKIEGLLRNFCERIKVPTTVNRIKGTQEAYIHSILENEDFKKFFNEDDLLFFGYLFSNEGLNLRNNIAHCFYDSGEYHSDQMLLLMAALLRLAKYDSKIES